MNITMLYPSDFFDITSIDQDYQEEYETAVQFPEFQTAFYNYDNFIETAAFKLYPRTLTPGLVIYRGWMLRPEEYARLYGLLAELGGYLINTPTEYNNCHLFPNTYEKLQSITPKTLWFPLENKIDWNKVSQYFKVFMIKDYVKSVKGSEFPLSFTTPSNEGEMETAIKKFIQLRGRQYTGGIVLKEYVKLKHYGAITNEYRVFYLKNRILTIAKNSNQPKQASPLPAELAGRCADLDSQLYTVDFGELEEGGFVVLETGDGQVSGLSPDQPILKFYDELRQILHTL